MEPARPRIQTVEVDPTAPIVPPAVQQPQPLEPTATPQVPSQNFPHKKSPWGRYMFIIPAIILMATILIVGVIVQRFFAPKPLPLPTPTATPELTPATPIPTPKPVVKPKTYLNTDLALSFEYPGNFVLGECQGIVYIFGPNFTQTETLCDSSTSAAIKIHTQNEPLTIQEGEPTPDEEPIIIGEKDGVKQNLVKGEGSYISRAVVTKNNITYVFSLINDEFEKEFDELIKTVEFIDDNPTANWKTYRNATFFYRLKHPEDWIASPSAKVTQRDPDLDYVEVSKNLNDKSKHSLVIETEKNVQNAQLKATDIVSSTKNLVGWKTTPSIDVRNIGGGTAQVMQGIFDNKWQVYVVIWYKNRIMQITWRDEVDRELQKTFDLVLSSFDLTD